MMPEIEFTQPDKRPDHPTPDSNALSAAGKPKTKRVRTGQYNTQFLEDVNERSN